MVLSFAIVSVLLGSLFVSNMILAQSGGEYDPWLDYNEDGIIDVNDLSPMGQAYGSLGDPTKNVYMKYSTYYWTATGYILPYSPWYFYNTTEGYRNMTIAVHTSTTVNVSIDYAMHLADGGDFHFPCGEFTVLLVGRRTYDISKAPFIYIFIWNPSLTEVAEVTLGIYMTA